MRSQLILVVDDNGPLRYALGRTLRQHGFDVLEASTGDEALKLSSAELPDLVLLDVNLPDIHGFDVARRLKAGDTTRNIPILQILAREREARKEAETANRLKDEFLATLSHELRTPLNAIMGWVSMLKQDALDHAGRARAMEVIERNLRSQQQLIDDILEVSRIVRGQLRLEMHPVDVVQAVTAAAESVAPTASAKHQMLTTSLPDAPILVAGDPSRLQQVFWNLLSNAVKYTPRSGRIEVLVSAGPSEAEITVRDTGIGITPDILPHIFERFRQGDSGPTREFGGLGLGLAIVRHLVEMHGGSVCAASQGAGTGASFTVALPRFLN